MVRANRRARVNSAAGLTDAQIKARNDQAHAAFMAARSASRRGFDQSGTKIRTSEGKDGKARTSFTGSGKKDTRNAAAARSSARAAGVLEKPKEKKKPFRAGTISQQSGMLNVDPYSTQARAAGKPKAKKQKVKPKSAMKSLDEIQGFLQGMNQIIKNEEATQARMTGNNLDTKMRHTTGEDGKRKVKEVKTGDRFNLQDRIGDPALRKATCRLWKTELNDTFNTLLDNFQHLYKDYETDKFNEAEGKGKKQKITTDSRRGAHGGDTQAQPKAIGESRADQAVMQS